MAKSNSLLKWKFDFHSKSSAGQRYGSGGSGSQALASCSSHTALHSDVTLNPPGFSPGAGYAQESGGQDEDDRLMVKRSWDIALGPLKQVPMNLFIMYMAGNSISIFPIMMVGMMFVRPVKALISLNSAFGTIEDGRRLIGQKFAYIIGNLLGVCLALYKCYSMGLLPTHQSDWLAFIQPQSRAEFAVGGFGLR